MSELRVETVGAAGVPAMRAALGEAGLPFEDLAEPGLALFAFAQDGAVVGYGGLEFCGVDALLRSIVIEPDRRGEGFGRQIVNYLSSNAASRGVDRIYLLTATATAYFEKRGFRLVDRRHAPASIAATRQMAGLCPASASLLSRTIAP